MDEDTAIEAEEIGTQADGPKALASVEGTARPSAWATSSARTPAPTAAAALDKSDLARSHAFHLFGVLAPVAAIAMSLLIGGDPTARLLFWIGAGVLGTCNIGLVFITSKADRYSPRVAGVLWVISTIAIQPAIYYFGPFSAVVMIDVIGIVFIALGRVHSTALATMAVCITGHVALAVPIAFGWIVDRSILPSMHATHMQLALAEGLILGFMIASYSLGRWARRMNARALTELANAMRVIGDQQQAMAEAADAEQRQKRANDGRWTGQYVGEFKLGLVLGRGSMGEVYEARSDRGQVAAVKLLNARATASSGIVERFHREMEIAARLESPHIVRVFSVSGPAEPVPFIAMERLGGSDLATRLRSESRLPSDELVVLVEQVARGLEVARLAGVVHRDLKPHNLWRQADGTWKILDFGVSKVLDSEGTLTGDGIVGTPQYMAPEQASGGDVTHLADVYALGAIAYRCLTGRTPFKGKDLAELVYQVVHAAPVRPSALGRVPRSIEDVLAIAMAKDQRRRFASALSFAQALIAARRGKPAAGQAPENAWQ
ncbi:MAG TPA: serine/threonine-protein kinase [Kofleriaceae bacterium]|nr:serine/threonine-protein kinase [Kofleriaceae bacterium]